MRSEIEKVEDGITTHVDEKDTRVLSVKELREGGYIFTPKQWLDRILFLESVAGVPGMVSKLHSESEKMEVS